MKILLLTLLLGSCALSDTRTRKVTAPKPLTFKEERVRCLERFLKLGISAENAKIACDWAFKRD